MEKNYSAEKPQVMIPLGARKRLNYGVWELSETELQELWEQEIEHTAPYDYFKKEHRYGYYSLEIGGARWNYSGIIESIVREKYTSDEMEAITNNMNAITGEFFNVLVTDGIIKATKYLVDSINSENTANFTEMQAWRAMAKRTAKEIFV